VYVTHDQQEAIFMGDRIAVMRRGVLEQVGTFDDLYYTPANRFVAEFIGTPPMVFVPVRKQDDAVIFANGAVLALPGHLSANLPDGPLNLGMRAESWQFGDGLPMVVHNVERIPTQQAAYVNGQFGDVRLSVLAPITQAHTAQVLLSPNWDMAYFFEAEAERVLATPSIPELF
jgi:ABC-type sugar transport system ATPase subunit